MEDSMILYKLNKLMDKAIKKDEVPVAALIVYKNKIIASAYNKTKKKNNILNHAEILVIEKASKKLNNWRLSDCSLYVTLEPCDMCKEIIKKSRIKEVIYYSKQNKYKTENEPNYLFKHNKFFSSKLSNFFKLKR